MSSSRRPVRILLAVLAFAAMALALSACGWSSDSKSVAEGDPVKLGDVQYKVVFSRLLNPNDAEDSAYLVGQPAPPRNGSYFGVFLQAQNSAKTPRRVPSSMKITDADAPASTRRCPPRASTRFRSASAIGGEDQLPTLDSTPQQGAIEGSLVLFRLPDSTSDNRPLTLSIPGPGGPAEVTLDY